MEEQDIPIDINTGKLLDWLVSRRHCNKDWQVHILKIREKINNAIQDMPVHNEIAKLLSGTHINYFHCKKIVEILKETEADSKNLFGRYGSQRMKDWLEILKLYEKDNVYLAEGAQMLMRNVNYEVPGFKKQIQKLKQMLTDLEKKEMDYKKSENTARADYNNLCQQLGISGENIKKELTERVYELPAHYDIIAKNIKSIDNVVKYYGAFVEFTLGNDHSGGCVPMIRYLIEKGNTTTYEWTYGEPPLTVAEPSLNINLNDEIETEENDIIDFGDLKTDEIDFNTEDQGGQIDFGEDIQLENAEGEIDWGGIEEVPTAPNEPIDFSISLEESGIVVEAAGNDGGHATGALALKILDNPDTRTDFINQLMELEAFLKLRLYEYKGAGSKNIVSMNQMQDSPILQNATLDSVQSMLDNVQVLISEITDNKIQHLHNIKHSSRYVEVLASNLKQKKSMIKKMESLQLTIQDKQAETRQQAASLQPILTLVIQKTKELASEIEKDISKKYKNRKVRLTGGINTL